MSTPNTLEKVLDHFAKHASAAEHSKLEKARSFKQGLGVLRQYARNRFNIRTQAWEELTKRSLRNWDHDSQNTVADLWRLMFYRIDLCREDLSQPSTNTEPVSSKADTDFSFSTISRARRIRGFGKIAPGEGSLSWISGNVTYFVMSNRKYKARLKNGKVEFVKYGFMNSAVRMLRAIDSITVFECGLSVSPSKHHEPDNYLFSKICSEGTIDMIKWAVALMHSGDILISSRSRELTTCIPCSTVGHDRGMCLSRPIRRKFFRKARFWYQRRTGAIFWDPCGGRYLMEVVISKHGSHNSFRRVKEDRVLERGSLRSCRVIELKKPFK